MRRTLVAAALLLALAAPAHAAPSGPSGPSSTVPVTADQLSTYPLEDFAGYQPQTTCTKKPKKGTIALGEYLVAAYGGSGGAVNRSCAGSSTSEHKDGRAVDWTLSAADPAQRAIAEAFLAAAFAPDATGEPAALARRMGIMYVIWADRSYSAWNGFAAKKYLSSSCRTRSRCSVTLRHRDHVHISLSKDGARGLTSFYSALQSAFQPSTSSAPRAAGPV